MDPETNDTELIEGALESTEQKPAEIDYSKIDYSKLDPTKIPHTIARMTPAFEGLMREVQDNRNKVKDLSDDVETLSTELKQKEQVEAKDPEETVTRGEMLKTVEQIVTQVLDKTETNRKKSESKKAQEESQRRLNDSCQRLEEEFTEAKTGKGLDAKTVIAEGLPYLAANEPELLAAARASTDPARKIYRLAITHVPAISERFEAHKNNQFLETIHKGRIPKGGGEIPGGRKKSDLVRLIEMPEEQLLAEIREDELSEEE